MFDEKDLLSPEGRILSLWMGKTDKSYDDFCAYFEGMEASDPSCPALRSLGATFIDVDFFVFYVTPGMKPVTVTELLKEVGCSKDSEKLILEKCKAIGLDEGNALFYYPGAIFKGDESALYNDLHFIGVFDSIDKDVKWNGKTWVPRNNE